MRFDRCALALALVFGAALPAAADAQFAGGGDIGRTYSLTREEKEHILAGGSEDRVDASLLRAQNGGDGKIHGEMGMMVGTRNTRGLYGSAVIPLGKDATIALSFDHYQSDPGKYRWRRNEGYYMPVPNAPY